MTRLLLVVCVFALCSVLSQGSPSSSVVFSHEFIDAELVEVMHSSHEAPSSNNDAGVDEAAPTDDTPSAPVLVGEGSSRYEVPQLPPLAIALDQETRPEVHPAAGVAPGEKPPTKEELDLIKAPLQPPEGCAHLIEAWKNYIWRHRTVLGSGVAGKDAYPQRVVEERFGYFCNNLKQHQLQSRNRTRITVKQPDLTFKDITEEKLTWNKYFDLENLQHLRGFRYAADFGGGVTHAAYLQREFIRTKGTDARPESRAAALQRKLDALPKSATPAAPAVGAPVSRRLLESAEMEDEIEPPVISTPIGALKPIARDPLIPDFDFSLNHNIIGAPYDQNNCGADYAIHTAALIESTFAIQCQDAPYKSTLAQLHFDDISSQELIACSKGNGCKNGDITDTLNYALRWPLRNRASYPLAPVTFLSEPHVVSVPQCVIDPAVEKSAARPLISSYGFAIHTCKQRSNDPNDLCLNQDEEELARFVAKQPVTAVIDANDAVFSAAYSGYIINSLDCSSALGAGDHVVTIVGLLTDAKTGKKVWKIQNSYGSNWGHDGFAYIEYGTNACGIANYNAFVQTTCQRPVGPNPPARPATPKPAPAAITAKSIVVPPPKPAIIPTVPVEPVLTGSTYAEQQIALDAQAAAVPWWQVKDAHTTVQTISAAADAVTPPTPTIAAPVAAATVNTPVIVGALKSVAQVASLQPIPK